MTSDSKTAKPKNRRPRKPAPARGTPKTTKLDRLAGLLARREGASIAEMMSATGWQQHSVRGALAGALRRRGLVITSGKVDGVRRYRSGAAR